MIAKITSGSSLYGALAYNQQKVDEGLATVLGSNILIEPLSPQPDIMAYMEDFGNCMPTNFRTEKYVFHASLNPHPDDKLSDGQLAEIAQEYMEQLGYGEQPYLIFKHSDIERQHIHIVSLRVDQNGKKIYDGKEGERSKAITEALEQKYGLTQAEGHRQGEVWQFAPVDHTKGELKKQIAEVVKPAVTMYQFQTLGEYKALLSLLNVGLEEIKGERNGMPYRGLVYNALDCNGERVGVPIKSSTISKSVGLDALEKRFEKSGVRIHQRGHREQTRTIVVGAMQKSRSEVEFRAALRDKGVDLVLRRNDQGRIYGATFIDHNNKCILNGSRLGKEFSANVINERFGGTQNTGTDLLTVLSIPQNSPRQGQPKAAQDQSAESPKLNIMGAVGSLFSGVSPDGGDDDYNKLIKKKKKKKRRYGRQM